MKGFLKKLIFVSILLFITFNVSSANALTQEQVDAVIGLVKSFGADQQTIDNLRISLMGDATAVSNTIKEGVYDFELEFENEELKKNTTILNRYDVVNGQLKNMVMGPNKKKYESYQKNTAMHQEIWSIMTRLLPLYKIDYLTYFYIASDGVNNKLAFIDKNNNQNGLVFAIDPLDFYNKEGELTEPDLLVNTIVHEYSHMISYGPTQLEYAAPESACRSGLYESYWGCFKEDSIMMVFKNQFWGKTFNEWISRILIDPDQSEEMNLVLFYSKHRKEFVSLYSATSPTEDFAEIFTDFALNDYECLLTNSTNNTFCDKRKFMKQEPIVKESLEYFEKNSGAVFDEIGALEDVHDASVSMKARMVRKFLEDSSSYTEIQKIEIKAYLITIFENMMLSSKYTDKEKGIIQSLIVDINKL